MAAKNRWDAEASRRIAAHVEAQIASRGITKAEMSRRLGVSESNLGRMLTGSRGMSAGFALAVHRRLSIPGDVLFDEEPRSVRSAAPSTH